MEPALAAEQFWRLTAEPVAVMRQSRLPAVREAATAQVKQVQTKKTKKLFWFIVPGLFFWAILHMYYGFYHTYY